MSDLARFLVHTHHRLRHGRRWRIYATSKNVAPHRVAINPDDGGDSPRAHPLRRKLSRDVARLVAVVLLGVPGNTKQVNRATQPLTVCFALGGGGCFQLLDRASCGHCRTGVQTMSVATKRAIDAAIAAHIADECEGSIVTGYVLHASHYSAELDTREATGYYAEYADGQPFHVGLGLARRSGGGA